MNLKNIFYENIKDKRVFIRADLNVPFKSGQIQDFTRINNIKKLVDFISFKGGKIILASHLGRPNGKKIKEFSIKQIVKPLSEILKKKIVFIPDCIGKDVELAKKEQSQEEILLLENLRFYKQEENNDSEFSSKLSMNCDFYVNEAFSCCHRKHASIFGITKYIKSFAGPNLISEINSLSKALETPKKPIVAIIGGSKISTKLPLIKNLIKNIDVIIIGGAMANTFLISLGNSIGKSIYEKDLISTAIELLNLSKLNNCKIVLPLDALTALKLTDHQTVKNIPVEKINNDEMILDIGEKTVSLIKEIIKDAKSIIWNGPLGVFETKPFDKSTVAIAKYIAKRTKYNSLHSIAGGGDTLSALNSLNLSQKMTLTSSGGGAFLEFLEGRSLPGVDVLKIKS